MKVTVKHKNFDTGMFDCVAIVDTSKYAKESTIGRLEYAWQWTNNVYGSWSRKIRDVDYFGDSVEVLMTREDGRGLRSTMIGDRMEIDGVEYEVAMMGFEPVAS